MKLRKINVPYEFTVESDNAVEAAVSLASKTEKCIVELLYVIVHYTANAVSGGALDIGSVVSMEYSADQSVETEVTSVGEVYVQKRFEDIKARFEQLNVQITYRILHAKDADSFTDLYTNEKADLIVYGAQKETSFASDWFLASEADKLIRKSNIPILIVKGEAKKFEKLVFASLFDDVTLSVAHSLRYVQELLGCELHLIKIIHKNSHSEYQQAQKEIKYFIERYNFTNCKGEVFESDQVEMAILRYAENVKADMIAVMSHKTSHSWLKSMIYGSTEQHLANYANIPVLVFHE